MIRKGVQDRHSLFLQALELNLGLFNLRLQLFDMGHHVGYLPIYHIQFCISGGNIFQDYCLFLVGRWSIGFEQGV